MLHVYSVELIMLFRYENVMRNVKSSDSASLVVLNYGNRTADYLENYLSVFEELSADGCPLSTRKGIHFSEFRPENIGLMLKNHTRIPSTWSQPTFDFHSSAEPNMRTGLTP